MEGTAVEDFQDYNNSPASHTDSARFPSLSSIQLAQSQHQDEYDDEPSLSGSPRQSSGPDDAVFDKASPHYSSPRTSSGSDDDTSAFDRALKNPSSPFAPVKTRSPFRAPSSVRAMQTDITPPRLSTPSNSSRPKIYTPSRQGTPRSLRSHNGGALRTPSKLSPSKRPKKEYPLILLHVNLLPLPVQYSAGILCTVLPPAILANWELIKEKATATILDRGVLIPHPREDYDLLEERLLESLELKQPRILKCGHFHMSPEEEADVLHNDDADTDDEIQSDTDDLDICEDCGRRIRDGRFGDVGTGSKRWDIKIFAANGLMRAGAWSAAWKEMERVDVEILPWMEDSMKRELELAREEEERVRREEGVGALDDERLREIYGQNVPQEFVDGLVDEMEPLKRTPERPRRRSRTSERRVSVGVRQRKEEEVPLGELLRNFVCDAVQDRRNLAILALSVIVLLMSLRGFSVPSRTASVQAPPHDLTAAPPMSTSTTTTGMSKEASSLPLASLPHGSVSPEATVPAQEVTTEAEAEVEEQSSWTGAAESLVPELLED